MWRHLKFGEKAIVPMEEDELLVFWGINFLMGYHKLPAYTLYWSSQTDLGVECVKDAMSRNRFSELLHILNVADNEARKPDNTDRLYKIRLLITQLNDQFQNLFRPTQVQSIDEAMILFKGRSSIKEYNPMKPIKHGYKIWCQAETNGYLKQFEIYQGKSVATTSDAPGDLGLGGQVVADLSATIQGKNHVLYFDNYFSSVSLPLYLLKNGIYACGTVRPGRKLLPQVTTDRQMKRGDCEWHIPGHEQVLFMKWKDNRSVHMLSTAHGTEMGMTMRRVKNGNEIEVGRPMVVAHYNSNMGGVDHADMLWSLYGFDRKSRKWWHRLFFGMMDMTMVNSYIAYCDLVEKIPLLD
jgi:hypothetical protein